MPFGKLGRGYGKKGIVGGLSTPNLTGLVYLIGTDGKFLQASSDGSFLLAVANGYNLLQGSDGVVLTGADGAPLIGTG